MSSPRRQPRIPLLTCVGLIAALIAAVGVAEETPESPVEVVVPQPLDERLTYAVSWAGIRCGEMEIVTYRTTDAAGMAVDRIIVVMRTSSFFDRIYRVRSRLDSYFDPIRGTSFRYEERSQEKKKRKNEVWILDHGAGEVTRDKNGKVTRIPFEADQVFDPLAFIFDLRGMELEIGSESSRALMTSKGALETVARATRSRTIRTRMGPCTAVAVVPEPQDKIMFSKSGAMVVWLEAAEGHRPCRIEFDLSFGKLVANLKSVGPVSGGDDIEAWETWDD